MTRTRNALALLVAGLLLVSLAACTSDSSDEPAGQDTTSEESVEPDGGTDAKDAPAEDAMTAGTEITAEALWTNELSSGEYREWEKAPGHSEPVKAEGPHGTTVQVLLNEEAAAALGTQSATEWPTGAVLVKDIFAAGGELQNVAYMLKTGEGWFYAEYGPGGDVIAEGLEIASCADCHAQGSDSVRTVALP